MNAKWLAAFLLCMAPVWAAEIAVTVGAQGEAKTLEEGLERARALRKPGDTVRILLSGTQYLAKPILLREKDSNTAIEGSTNATLSQMRIGNAHWGRNATFNISPSPARDSQGAIFPPQARLSETLRQSRT